MRAARRFNGAGGGATQLWTLGANGSLYTLDVAGHTGYCLKIASAGPSSKAGAQVYSANCGGTSNAAVVDIDLSFSALGNPGITL